MGVFMFVINDIPKINIKEYINMDSNGILFDALLFIMSTYGRDFIKRLIFPADTLTNDLLTDSLVIVLCALFIITYKIWRNKD